LVLSVFTIQLTGIVSFGLVTVANKDWVAEYRAKNTEILKKYGGRILARGKPSVTLEGTAPDVNTMIVVEFPSMEQAKAWYEDPDYQKLVRLRQTGSQADFVLIEGMKQ
jgi:uncharacterized protein (DUF1330 family)